MQNTLQSRYIAAKQRLFDIYYGDLNARQREAVFTTEGSLLVLAGAGSGKTTVLVRRIAFIVKYGNAYFSTYTPHDLTEARVRELERAAELTPEEIEPILNEFISSPGPPWQMLAITFTNKAANEIKSRLRVALPDEASADAMWAGTFHSVCARILRTYGDRIGYDKGFTIYDTTDTKNAVTEAMKSLGIDEKSLPVKTVMSAISRAKENLLTPEQFTLEYALKDFRQKQIARGLSVEA